ncbi:uncharacterized protein BT62DRAFT_926853 [Guyanagaster necrorhizus]|uniref:Uncharacterized protein n=1 Tax=Guyanagaster necrorhizus TaxID=856835 RepID=A0A9P7W0S8_9AGAR|nr:uncharacterized protein BT62DRAFT_926853 [Guyanagaster necrorhizus MCA 3950]KAG7451201.1 hypothetical protein BT62DRAFT_926853 [Guyanagaster necrorhizus MCA 3950]
MQNAVAGPSRAPTPPPPSISGPVPLFLPPPVQYPPAPALFTSTEDLISHFCLLDAYDKYVRPFISSDDQGANAPPTPSISHPLTPGGPLDKGKGKEVTVNTPLALAPQTPAADPQDGDDDDPGGKGEKKKKNNTYKHLIKGTPGKHSMKKDDYLTSLILGPGKERIKITPFDLKTQREAFSVSAEGLKGWNPNTLIQESIQAREDRKKRKELRRLAKAHISASASHTPQPTPTPIQAPIPSTPASLAAQRTGTPRPVSAVPRPGSVKPYLPPVQVTGLNGRTSGGTPRTATPHPLSAPPVSASSLAAQQQVPRGKKRERDDSVSNSNKGAPPQPQPSNIPPKAIINAKAGIPGARPRPIKKQRMDIQGQSRDTGPMQQPTPQGV